MSLWTSRLAESAIRRAFGELNGAFQRLAQLGHRTEKMAGYTCFDPERQRFGSPIFAGFLLASRRPFLEI